MPRSNRLRVLGREPAVPDERQVDAGEPGKLAVEQDARAHLDVADQRLQARRERQGIDQPLHRRARSFPAPAPRR